MAEVWSSKKVHFGRNIRTINCQCTRNWSILSKINPVPEEHRRKSGAILLTKIWNGFFIFYLFSENNFVSCQGWNRSWWFSRHLVQNFDSADLPQLVWLDCQNWFSAAILVENMVADLIWCFFLKTWTRWQLLLGELLKSERPKLWVSPVLHLLVWCGNCCLGHLINTPKYLSVFASRFAPVFVPVFLSAQDKGRCIMVRGTPVI